MKFIKVTPLYLDDGMVINSNNIITMYPGHLGTTIALFYPGCDHELRWDLEVKETIDDIIRMVEDDPRRKDINND